MSLWPVVAPVRSTQAGSPGPLQDPLLIEASQYPEPRWSFFHEFRIPSPSVFLTVVLTITAPHETHPALLMAGLTCVVAKLSSSLIPRLLPVGLLNVHVGLSQVPYHPGNAGSLLPYRNGRA